MSKLGWLVAGLAIGALAVLQYRDNPKAKQAVDDAVGTAKEFGAAVAEGFREREAELKKDKSPDAE
ncbi:MAG: hypothetical protein RL198_536 [Actinomycetota bacterium]|jgi:hypothetical protein